VRSGVATSAGNGHHGGFAVRSFLEFFPSASSASTPASGTVLVAVGFLQSRSFLAATRLGDRFGLVKTMVFRHLPSNLLLNAIEGERTPPTWCACSRRCDLRVADEAKLRRDDVLDVRRGAVGEHDQHRVGCRVVQQERPRAGQLSRTADPGERRSR
jgi:hypothetical protein